MGEVGGELRSIKQATLDVPDVVLISFCFPTQGGVGTLCFALNPINVDRPVLHYTK